MKEFLLGVIALPVLGTCFFVLWGLKDFLESRFWKRGICKATFNSYTCGLKEHHIGSHYCFNPNLGIWLDRWRDDE